MTLVPLPTKSAKYLPWISLALQYTTYSIFLLRGVIWHFLLAMGPKSKYLELKPPLLGPISWQSCHSFETKKSPLLTFFVHNFLLIYFYDFIYIFLFTFFFRPQFISKPKQNRRKNLSQILYWKKSKRSKRKKKI